MGAAIMGMAGNAAAQRGMGMPEMHGVWNPVVGAGAVYDMDNDGKKQQMEFAVVGKEDVQGKEGYWMEFSVQSERGSVVGKNLIVMDGEDTRIQRMIVQPPGQDPMEFPVGMMAAHRNPVQPADIRKQAKDMGKETITTPAGTFACEHLQSNDGKTDLWISPQVPPYGLVKSVSKDGGTMTLVRVETNATDKITGTPRVFNPMGMGGKPQ
jgi:hypothetical protein